MNPFGAIYKWLHCNKSASDGGSYDGVILRSDSFTGLVTDSKIRSKAFCFSVTISNI